MRLSDSRIVVLDVVASVASGMPVYYPIPDTMVTETELPEMEPRATASSIKCTQTDTATSDLMSPFKRLLAFVQTHLTITRTAVVPPHERRRRAF
ncbi:hypothetical protein V1291_002400 [Nitrobacteraceae bacterium AZCC 1564]